MSENAVRDQNFVPSKLAVLNTDTVQGTNLVTIKTTDDGIKVNLIDTISFTMQPVSPRDENYRACWLFEGEDGQAYPAVANSSGALLIEL